MKNASGHTFHIPVMGLGFTIDSPIKVARFGISSVVSIIQVDLIEQMREFYCKQSGEEYTPIPIEDVDHRAKRVTAYLDLMQRIVDKQVEDMKNEPFEEGNDIVKYFKLLPEDSPLKGLYVEMTKMQGAEKDVAQIQLRGKIVTGAINVNIMTKVDNLNYAKDGQLLPVEYSDATSALRGFANSTLNSSVVFSAGLNPRLFAFLENFPDFFPDANGIIRKKIILKVSDYRSAIIQGKFLAKKGLWVSEFRIESGLNCGGHAFPTEGYLLGPILEEFKIKKQELARELTQICNQALSQKNRLRLSENSEIQITVQGGIGTSREDKFLREYYNIDSTGWGSPFLLVPEATNVDEATLQQLAHAKQADYFLSHASPLGVPFNNFRKSSSEEQRKERIQKNRPGSPCYKKLLAFNTEFTEQPICTASREYQHKKLKAVLADPDLSEEQRAERSNEITEKDCLCEGLASSALLTNNIPDPHKLVAVTICPGPNLAYFSKVFSLEEMVGHIYGRTTILNSLYRPHMFINEFKMYVDYLRKEIDKNVISMNEKQAKYFSSFKGNLFKGMEYYRTLLTKMVEEPVEFKKKMKEELDALESDLNFATVVLKAAVLS
ncbi:hypothetical protein [Flavisolibacter tropicus]|uniref:Uncharacterized protein n=1 Tax=Flavisolibacter tropicus TaxID=1492898 RepID=A0A172U260_9BACT|nr:hypothetical protein [Flavisolibacter tropicus]ANE53425.1 hypothetical protein SY85_10775 [Flavisolibacter tropicus]